MSVAGGHSTKKQQDKLFIHIEQQTRTERQDDRKKKRSWISIHILNCLFNGLSIDTGSSMLK